MSSHQRRWLEHNHCIAYNKIQCISFPVAHYILNTQNLSNTIDNLVQDFIKFSSWSVGSEAETSGCKGKGVKLFTSWWQRSGHRQTMPARDLSSKCIPKDSPPRRPHFLTIFSHEYQLLIPVMNITFHNPITSSCVSKIQSNWPAWLSHPVLSKRNFSTRHLWLDSEKCLCLSLNTLKKNIPILWIQGI